MTTSFDSVAMLSEQELLEHFADLVVRDRRTTSELLVAIAEIDDRKLWAAHACSSMFTFCMERFHMSEQVTAKRLWAARTARRFPVVLEMVERGELHLGAIHVLAKHLTDENHGSVLERARHKSCREVERLVAELAPRADVPSRIRALPERRGASADPYTTEGLEQGALANWNDRKGAANDPAAGAEASAFGAATQRAVDAALALGNSRDEVCTEHGKPGGSSKPLGPVKPALKPIVALSPRRYKIEITVDESTHDKLRSLQDLLARAGTGRDPAKIISRAIDVLLGQTLSRKAAFTNRSKPAKAACRERVGPTASAARTENPAARAAFASDDTNATPAPSDAVAAAGGQRSRRNIPAAVRREVWLRDSGRCCYVDRDGRRCRETGNIEFHHRDPFALGGRSTAENIELRCAAHNQFQADLDFGRSFMDAKRGRSPGATRRTMAGAARGDAADAIGNHVGDAMLADGTTAKRGIHGTQRTFPVEW